MRHSRVADVDWPSWKVDEPVLWLVIREKEDSEPPWSFGKRWGLSNTTDVCCWRPCVDATSPRLDKRAAMGASLQGPSPAADVSDLRLAVVAAWPMLEPRGLFVHVVLWPNVAPRRCWKKTHDKYVDVAMLLHDKNTEFG